MMRINGNEGNGRMAARTGAKGGRRGATADLLKALIRLAASGVKVREGHPRGAFLHATEAGRLFESVIEASGRTVVHGLDIEATEFAEGVLADLALEILAVHCGVGG